MYDKISVTKIKIKLLEIIEEATKTYILASLITFFLSLLILAFLIYKNIIISIWASIGNNYKQLLFLTAAITALIYLVMVRRQGIQIKTMQDELRILSEVYAPNIDAKVVKFDKDKIKLKILNSGGSSAKRMVVGVDIELKKRIDRYLCGIFPSLPSDSAYSSDGKEPIIEIQPKFWVKNPEDESISHSVTLPEYIQHLKKLLKTTDLPDRCIKLNVYLILSKKKIDLETHLIDPFNYRDSIEEASTTCVSIEVLPRGLLAKFKYYLKNSIEIEVKPPQINTFKDSPIEVKIVKIAYI
jgi:hypothetical protein